MTAKRSRAKNLLKVYNRKILETSMAVFRFYYWKLRRLKNGNFWKNVVFEAQFRNLIYFIKKSSFVYFKPF